ncbi:MAG: hypothetical protein QNK33_08465 [Bacteroidales bacterium]|nr:hypothetical protein [Bacteroidales bacterium]
MLKPFRHRLFSKILCIVLSALMLNLSACYYYKVSPSTGIAKEEVKKFQEIKKTILIHYGGEAWRFTDILIENEIITGKLIEYVFSDLNRISVPNKSNRYYPRKHQADALLTNEVHIYISEYSKIDDQRIAINPDAIEKIEVFDKDTGATTASWILGALGVGAAAFALSAIIILLTKSSCPFIYSWDGESYKFTGEIYSGAIQPALERHDYLPLPDIAPEDGIYRIKMTNEVKEIQHTNMTELLVFDHPDNIKVLVDKYGEYHAITSLHSPLEATNLSGHDILNFVGKKDSLNYFGDQIKKGMSISDGLIAKFEVPPLAEKASLVVNAKNSLWLDYLFTRFHGMFGENYQKFQDKQKNASPEEMDRWYLEQNLPLSVFIEHDGEWEKLDHYNLVGPMAFKEDVIQFDVSSYAGKDISIKLETGYMFWEIDYVGIDYSEDLELLYTRVPVYNAIDNKGIDIRPALLADDSEYYIQPEVGDEVILSFTEPLSNDKAKTVILHSKGYYLILRDQEGRPDRKTLREFRKKGRLPEYSIELFEEFKNSRSKNMQN